MPKFKVRFLLLLYKTTLNFLDVFWGLTGRFIRADIRYFISTELSQIEIAFIIWSGDICAISTKRLLFQAEYIPLQSYQSYQF